jgi:hypothetical protein
LFSSGLIAGGSLCGILYAILVGTNTIDPFQVVGNVIPALHSPGVVGQLASSALFLALALVTARAAQKKIA